MSDRQYDIVVWGATGYTGKLCSEHITLHFPTDLKWALAGRSANKLEAVAAECKELNPNRTQPAIEACNLDNSELSKLAKKTKILIATVGPYAIYGEPAFKACAENGTHYLDVTGEVAYVSAMIKKYENAAKASGAIMIPQTGVDSAPADLITWTIVNMIKEKMSAKTAEVVFSLYELKGRPSGGTLASVFGLMDAFSVKELVAANQPYAISPIKGPKTPNPSSFVTRLFGVRAVRDLGILTTSLTAMIDTPIVHRSWGLLGGEDFYGPNFYFSELLKARNHLTAIMLHFALLLGSALLGIRPLRQVARKYVYQPGEGPTKEEVRNDRLEYRAIGMPDVQTTKPPRAFCKGSFEGSLYAFTGVLVAEAAITILKDSPRLSGGIYTPACLGQSYIDRLDASGFRLEKKFFED